MDMQAIEKLVDSYVACWLPKRPTFNGIYERNDFGCEHLQVFRAYSVQSFEHDELSQLCALLTRSLRGQINDDHMLLWAWCAQLTHWFRHSVPLFRDEWVYAFTSLAHLVLSGKQGLTAGTEMPAREQASLRYVNRHLLEVEMRKHLIGAPLSLALLEGLLRRKNYSHVSVDGTVIQSFSVTLSNGKVQTYQSGNHLNRINVEMRLFEQLTTANRGRQCLGLGSFTQEVSGLYPSPLHPFDLVDTWRNDLLHGNQYWQDRLPIVLNLICILVLDEIEPSVYRAEVDNQIKNMEWERKTASLMGNYVGIRGHWETFPPDLPLWQTKNAPSQPG